MAQVNLQEAPSAWTYERRASVKLAKSQLRTVRASFENPSLEPKVQVISIIAKLLCPTPQPISHHPQVECCALCIGCFMLRSRICKSIFYHMRNCFSAYYMRVEQVGRALSLASGLYRVCFTQHNICPFVDQYYLCNVDIGRPCSIVMCRNRSRVALYFWLDSSSPGLTGCFIS